MDLMKKLFFALMVMIAAVVLIGCDDAIELDTPTGVTLTGSVVSWTAVEDATGYRVLVDITPHEATGTSFDLSTLSLAPGSYTITVVAFAEDAVSLPSASLTFVVEDTTGLDVPSVTGITDGVLSWGAVDTADGYIVTVEGEDYAVEGTTFDLSSLFLPEGSYDVTVTAVRGTETSEASTVSTYTVAFLMDADTVYATILSSMDPMYAPDMDESDFVEEWEFDEYMQASGLARAYANAAASSQMTEEEAVLMFGNVMTMPMMIGQSENLSSLMLQMDDMMADLGESSDKISNVLMQLLMFALEQAQAMAEEDILFLEDELLLAEATTTDYLSDPAFTDLYNMLLPYVPEYYLTDYQEMFTTDFPDDLGNALWSVQNIAWDLAYDLEFHDPWYLEDGTVYDYIFYETLLAMAQSGEYQPFLANLANNSFDMFAPFHTALDNLYWIQGMTNGLSRTQEQLDMVTSLRTVVESDPMMFAETLQGVIDYVTLFYDTLSPELIAQIDTLVANGTLSLEEIVILKDEIVDVLQTTLPSPEDFEALYLTLFHVSESLSGYDMDFIASRAGELADIEHMTINLALDVVGDVTQATIEEVMLLTETLIVPGYYQTEEYENCYWDEILQDMVCETRTYEYWVSESVEPHTMIELLVWIAQYADEVNTTYADDIAAIEAVYGSTFDDLFIADAAVFAKTILQDNLSTDEYMMVSSMIDELLLDLPNIEDGLAVFGLLGEDLFDWFVSTEGSLFHLLADLGQSDDQMMNPEGMLIKIDGLIDEIKALNDVLLGYNDPETIEGVLSALRVPVMFATMPSGMFETYSDFNLFFDELVVVLADLVFDVATLEEIAVNEAEALELVTLVFHSDWTIIEEEALMGAVIVYLDNVFTDPTMSIVNDIVTTIFDDLLTISPIDTMTGIPTTELATMRDEILLGLFDLVLELRNVASYDFTDLSEQQIWDMHLFFENAMFFLMDLLYDEQPVYV
jgi:hypothetical protein